MSRFIYITDNPNYDEKCQFDTKNETNALDIHLKYNDLIDLRDMINLLLEDS